MRILLLTPRNPRNFWTFDGTLPFIDKDCLLPNLSMPTLAGLTPREHEVVLVDENLESIDFDASADIIGVTGYIVHKKRMLEIVQEFHKRGRFVAVGGPYASLCPEDFRGRCDALFVGEAEETWTQFLQDFAAGQPKAEYEAKEKPDMSLAPCPRFDLLRTDRYQAMTVQFGRGCPFRCEFCDIIVVYGRRPRNKSVEQLLAEIEECHRLGVRQIFVADDNFIANKPLAKTLLRALGQWGRERGYPISFGTELSVNVAQDDELLALMRDANMTTVFLGIESPRKSSLEETKKNQNVRGDLVEQVHHIQSFGVQVQAGMIVGFDNDDPSIFEEQLRFIQAARIPLIMMGMLQAFPKTPLYNRVRAEGRLLSEALAHSLGFSNIDPAGMTRLELYRGYRWLLGQIYSNENFGARTRAFLYARGEQVNRGRNLRVSDFKILGRFLHHTLFREKPAQTRFILGMLAEVLWKRPQAFKEACSFLLSHQSLRIFVADVTAQLDHTIEMLEKEAENTADGGRALSIG
jgi:radical SAM superfamily enzyme YgiQ (UPF0313 family)